LGDLLTTSINTRRFAEKQSLSSRENPRVVTSHGTFSNAYVCKHCGIRQISVLPGT
ncbi:hypothetical protein T12_8554, partial [Trichinella patagoniensis]